MATRIHIIGAGLAGLAAAIRLRYVGAQVTVYEASPRAGGRCRSYFDPQLGCVIDNGNHKVLSGNTAVMSYLNEIGASDRMISAGNAAFHFLDPQNGLRWTVAPGKGAMPWWIFDAQRRVPDTRVSDYWSIVRLMAAGRDATVGSCLDPASVLFQRFWKPLTLAVLNAMPEESSAALLQAVFRETVAKGADTCRTLIARRNLGDTLVDPAINALAQANVEVLLGTRIERLEIQDRRVVSLAVNGQHVAVGAQDMVVLAVPAWVVTELLPGLSVPPPGQPIVNVHYRLAESLPQDSPPQIVGLIGTMTQWVIRRDDIASVTISGAVAEADMPAEDIAARCWPEVAAALGLTAVQPPSRVIKERRATPAQTPAAVAMRPKAQSAYENLLLSGDWTDTGLPATIEAAVRSGFTAARLVEQRMATGHRGAA